MAGGSWLEIDGIILGQVVTVLDMTQVETDIKGTSLFDRTDAKAEEEDDLVTARGLLAIIRGMQKLKDNCFEELASVVPGISLSHFQYHWERFWPGYLDEPFGPVREMIEGEKEVDLTELHRGYLGVFVVGIGNELLKMSTSGLGILDNSGMVTTTRTDEPVRNDDIICLLNGIDQPCILRQNGLHYSFVAGCGMTSFQTESVAEAAFEGYETRRIVLV